MTTVLPTDHSGLQVLPIADCLHYLRTARVGRIAFMSAGYPIILPVNHGMDGDAVVLRTDVGSKLDAAENELPVAFEIDGIDADRRAGWSVLVRGDAQMIESADEVARLDQLGVWPWADGVRRRNWIRIRTHEITGRRIITIRSPDPAPSPSGSQDQRSVLPRPVHRYLPPVERTGV